MTWPFGGISGRAREIDPVDSHDVTDPELENIFDFSDAVARYLGGHSIVVRFLARAARQWPGPVSILDLGCGRGALARAIVDWSRSRGLEVKVHGADKYGRVVHLARERHRGVSDLTFETRDLNDPFYLQGQQFDYVVSSQALHREPDGRTVTFLKTANRLARRGVIVSDWIRDPRASLYLSTLARFWKDPVVRAQAALSIRRGFSVKEAEQLRKDGGLEFASLRVKFGYRVSIEGERALATAPALGPLAGLAGT